MRDFRCPLTDGKVRSEPFRTLKSGPVCQRTALSARERLEEAGGAQNHMQVWPSLHGGEDCQAEAASREEQRWREPVGHRGVSSALWLHTEATKPLQGWKASQPCLKRIRGSSENMMEVTGLSCQKPVGRPLQTSREERMVGQMEQYSEGILLLYVFTYSF